LTFRFRKLENGFESFVFREQLFFGKIGERRKALSLSIFNSLFQSKSFPQSNAITGNVSWLGVSLRLKRNRVVSANVKQFREEKVQVNDQSQIALNRCYRAFALPRRNSVKPRLIFFTARKSKISKSQFKAIRFRRERTNCANFPTQKHAKPAQTNDKEKTKNHLSVNQTRAEKKPIFFFSLRDKEFHKVCAKKRWKNFQFCFEF
jgi:hypothetical protein